VVLLLSLLRASVQQTLQIGDLLEKELVGALESPPVKEAGSD